MTSGRQAPVRVVSRSKAAAAKRAYRGGIVARDWKTGESLLATDYPRRWWSERGRDGTRSIACVACLAAV